MRLRRVPVRRLWSLWLLTWFDGRKFFENGTGSKPKPQQSTLAFDRRQSQRKEVKHGIPRNDAPDEKQAVADHVSEDTKMENDEDVTYKAELKDVAGDTDMVDRKVLPCNAGTACYPPIQTRPYM